jgi:CheY-like chemotaxis protein
VQGSFSSRPLRVLVVDDCPDTRGSLCLLLDLWGHKARTAADGPSALAEAFAFHPEVVLLDIGLPQMDGYEVARELRRLPGTRHALLVATTGFGQGQDVTRAREAGFDHHLLKPFDPDVLQALLDGCSARPVAASASGAGPLDPGGRRVYARKSECEVWGGVSAGLLCGQ